MGRRLLFDYQMISKQKKNVFSQKQKFMKIRRNLALNVVQLLSSKLGKPILET